MRALLLATALLAAHSSGVREPAGQASEQIPQPEAAAPRVLASAERDCTVSWVHDYRSLDLMADAADLIVRAQVVGQDVVQLRAFGANGRVSLRDARRTTVRVLETLKGAAEPSVRVIEDVCPGLEDKPGDEWILFLGTPFDPKYGPDDPRVHRFTVGGPQGQFRIRASRIAGPFFAFQHVVREYGGTAAGELLADLRAVRPLDLGPSRSLLERAGWAVLARGDVDDIRLPADFAQPARFGDLPFHVFADASRRAGHDLAPFAGRTLRAVSYLLELDRPSTEKQYRATVLHSQGAVVGTWITVGHNIGDGEIYAVTERDAALAARGRR